jgi:hypothetical protein
VVAVVVAVGVAVAVGVVGVVEITPTEYTKMIFAFDYDGTWSEDPIAFEAHVAFLNFRGHTCLIFTGRNESHKLTPGIEVPYGIRIIYCDRKPKRRVLADLGSISTGFLHIKQDRSECLQLCVN